MGKGEKRDMYHQSKPTETDNDKYTFHCFGLKLSFVRKAYKM